MKNICIVGYGAVGPIHARALEAVENAKLYAICDIDPVCRARCREKYDVKEYESFDCMLRDEQIDSVHICTPHYLHFDMISKALKAGKEVVTEKPVTTTKEDFTALNELDSEGKVCVVFQNRLNPCVDKLKRLVSDKTLGRVKSVKGILTWHRDKEYYGSGAWRGKWETEGGCLLINQAIHTLDLFSYLIGDIRWVRTAMFNYSLEGVIEAEDTLSAFLGFENGVRGVFFATNAYGSNSAPLFEVVFENGVVTYRDKQLWMGDQLLEQDDPPALGKAYWGDGHKKLIRRYYDEQAYFSIADARNTMETMFAMYESAKNDGKPVYIKN